MIAQINHSCVNPVLICIAKESKRCPKCGAARDGYINRFGKVIPGGFDLLMPKNKQEHKELNSLFDEMFQRIAHRITIFAACRCENCGFSF